MEKTESLITTAGPSASASKRSTAAVSQCGYTRVGALARRQPSMMEAWLSSSEQISDAQRPMVVITPRLAAYPVVNSTAAGADRQAAMRSSKRL